MEKLILYLQVIPIILITSYVGFYFFINYQIYADLHYQYLQPLDNVFVLVSLIIFIFGGYKIWSKLTIKSFLTVLLLNIITEVRIENYYQIYSLIVQLFLITVLITQLPKKIRWK